MEGRRPSLGWDLPPHLREVSTIFGEAAERLVAMLPDNREREKALDFLLLAKDAAVRARLARPARPSPEHAWNDLAKRWVAPSKNLEQRGPAIMPRATGA